MAKNNIDIPVNYYRMPARTLKQHFRWIEVTKQGKWSKFSLFFLPGSNRNRQDRQIIHRHPQGKMGKTPVERAELMGGSDPHHWIRTLRKYAHHLIGFQKLGRLPEERRLSSLISLEWKGSHQRNCLLQQRHLTHVIMTDKSYRAVERRHQQGGIKEAAVIADNKKSIFCGYSL